MSRERTDADDFSLAMFGSIVVALVLTFVIAGFVTHWEKSEAFNAGEQTSLLEVGVKGVVIWV